jgi:DNA polymerase-3 subunit gamma/tau
VARADTETFRQRWPEILDAVRDERKVAWILLRNTTAESVEGSVLTVAFASEGEARSFASSGHEAILTSAVASLLGVNVRIRPVAAGAGPAGSVAGRPGGDAPVPTSPRATPATGAAAGAAGGPAAHAAAGPGTTPGGHGTSATGSGTTPGEAPPAGDAGHPAAPAPGGPSRPASAAGRPGARRSGPPAAGRAGSGRRQPGTASSRPDDSSAEEPWPDEEGNPGQPGLSGMELIARQLGGQVIEEIEDS